LSTLIGYLKTYLVLKNLGIIAIPKATLSTCIGEFVKGGGLDRNVPCP